jgi:DeoR family transcriptional regulator, aga operon transcriptional repressor
MRRRNSPPTSDRRRVLMQRIRDLGYVDAVSLAQELKVDGSTIRRDLAQLTRAGLIRRTHGGALAAQPDAAIDTPYDDRRHINLEAKKKIARAAAELVKDQQTVILDNGSTVFQIAVELRRRRNLTIITNDLQIAITSANHPTNRLHVAGGVLLDTVYTLVGPATVAAFEGLHADWAFLGAEGVDATAGVTNINVIEIPVKRAMMKAAAKTVFVADRSKFGRLALATVCPTGDAHLIFTDESLPEDQRSAFGDRLRCV